MKQVFSVPVIQGSMAKQNYELIFNLSPAVSQRIVEYISPNTIKVITEATKVDWLPVEVDIECTEAVWKVLGDRGTYDFFQESILRSARTGLLSPILRGAFAILRFTPNSFIKRYDASWQRIFRNCGRITYEEKKEGLTYIAGEGWPVQMINSKPYLISLAGAFGGAITLARVKGSVIISRVAPLQKRVEFIASWAPRTE